MASTSGDGNDGEASSSDNMSSVCGYKDVNEFSQVPSRNSDKFLWSKRC